MFTAALMSCGKNKLPHPAPAGEMYTGKLLYQYRRLVEAMRVPWFLLSARYGLLDPAQLIEPYNVTVRGMPAADKAAWYGWVNGQLHRRFPPAARFLIMLSEDYLPATAGFEVVNPFKGMRHGHRQQAVVRMMEGLK